MATDTETIFSRSSRGLLNIAMHLCTLFNFDNFFSGSLSKYSLPWASWIQYTTLHYFPKVFLLLTLPQIPFIPGYPTTNFKFLSASPYFTLSYFSFSCFSSPYLSHSVPTSNFSFPLYPLLIFLSHVTILLMLVPLPNPFITQNSTTFRLGPYSFLRNPNSQIWPASSKRAERRN